MLVDDLALHEVLVWLGLNELQAKVYLAVLEAGMAGVEIVSKRLDFSQSDVARALDELEELGLIKEVPCTCKARQFSYLPS